MVTIKAVAKRAGVSITSVSHVINRPDRVTPELRERVLQAIEEMGYQPNPSARTLRTGRTNLLALMISDICNPFWTELAHTIHRVVENEGYEILIFDTDVPSGKSETRAEQYARQISQKRFDGAIVAGEAAVGTEHILEEMDIPTVYVGQLEKPVIDSVTIDDCAAAYDATTYLIKQGYNRIAHITGELRFISGRERRRGYEQALTDHGLLIDDQLIFAGTYLSPAGRHAMKQLLSMEMPPDAVFIANARMAIGALASAFDMGRKVPDDVAVMCIDRYSEMDDVRPRLTTIDYNPGVIGEITAQLMLDRLQGLDSNEPRSIIIPHTLLKGDSA